MKTLLPLSLSFFFAGTLIAQNKNFEQTVQFIQKKVTCCSVPFTPSNNKKVTSISIDSNGNTAITYSDKRKPQQFNIYKLYKAEQSKSGIDTIIAGKVIQFSISEQRARLIKFGNAADAKAVYQALMQLVQHNKNEKEFSNNLNFKQTLNEINARLLRWAEKGNTVKVNADENGNIDIVNRLNQHLKFNLLELDQVAADETSGIFIQPCNRKLHAPLAWINFIKVGATVAFLRLNCKTPVTELEIIKNAFLQLKILSAKKVTVNKTADGVYFLARNASLHSANTMLTNSVRSIDDKNNNSLNETIKSNGEGWLDKDSLPVGKWNFYAKTTTNKEYLFKSGLYQRTKSEMFRVMDIDSADLAKKYQLSFYNLQQQHAQMIPFVKANTWEYYHPDGVMWKKVNYRNNEIPISTSIVMMDAEKTDHTSLVVNLKEKIDEWEE